MRFGGIVMTKNPYHVHYYFSRFVVAYSAQLIVEPLFIIFILLSDIIIRIFTPLIKHLLSSK